LAALLLAVWLLAGCGGQKEYSSTLLAMDTVMTLTACGPHANDALSRCGERLRELDALLSVTDENSDIYAANHSGGAPVEVSPDTAQLLARALELCAAVDGALDVTIYPVVRAWGFTTGTYRVPTDGELEALLENVGYQRVELNGRQLRLPAGMALDLGAVAKGYAGDLLLAQLAEDGVNSAILELGGSVHTLGARPDGSPWRVAVRNPDGEGYAGVLNVTDCSVVTSGGYQRFFEQDGVTYWHIMDPATGRPARSGVQSVTIVAPEGLLCDTYATALFVMGPERAASFWRATGGFDYILIDSQGTLHITEGLADRFTPLGPWENTAPTVIHNS